MWLYLVCMISALSSPTPTPAIPVCPTLHNFFLNVDYFLASCKSRVIGVCHSNCFMKSVQPPELFVFGFNSGWKCAGIFFFFMNFDVFSLCRRGTETSVVSLHPGTAVDRINPFSRLFNLWFSLMCTTLQEMGSWPKREAAHRGKHGSIGGWHLARP